MNIASYEWKSFPIISHFPPKVRKSTSESCFPVLAIAACDFVQPVSESYSLGFQYLWNVCEKATTAKLKLVNSCNSANFPHKIHGIYGALLWTGIPSLLYSHFMPTDSMPTDRNPDQEN